MNHTCTSRKASALLIFVASCLVCRASYGEVTYSELKAYTEWSVKTGRVKLPKPSFDWSGNTMTYRLYNGPDFCGLSDAEPLTVPIVQQFTVLAIRKYRNDPTQRKFWQPVLQKVETVISGMVDTINAGQLSHADLMTELNNKEQQINDIYQTELSHLAHSEGKQGAGLKEVKYTCTSYLVKVRTTPTGGTIRYIPAGSWSLYEFMTKHGHSDYPCPDWTTLAQSGGEFSLTGMNWFAVNWPDGRKSMDLVNVENNHDIVLAPD